MTDNKNNLKEIIDLCVLSVPHEYDAFKVAHLMLNVNENDMKKDDYLSDMIGCPVYVTLDNDSYICEYKSKLEVNFKDGSSKDIWINI